MTKFLFIVFICTCLSCSHPLPTRDYASTEASTGGFNEFLLHLDRAGTLKLTLTTTVQESQDEAGEMWTTRTITVAGTWKMGKGKIEFSLDKSKHAIDSLFVNTDWIDLAKKPVLVFSDKADTAYIYGIPCVPAVSSQK